VFAAVLTHHDAGRATNVVTRSLVKAFVLHWRRSHHRGAAPIPRSRRVSVAHWTTWTSSSS